MNSTVKKLLKPIASLYLTVPLLFMAMVLVYAGTSAQKETGVWEVQHWYFHSFFCFIPFKYLLPLSDWWWQHGKIPLGGGHAITGFPFLGGYTLIGLLLVNLLAAHTVRFKFTWKRTGILMIHFGLILLLVGEVMTSRMANEAVMSLNDGQSQQYADDIRDVELAVIDPSSADHDTVVVVASSQLQTGATVHDARLPFDVHIDDYYPNATPLGPMQVSQFPEAKALATAGANRKLALLKDAPFSGVGDEAEKVNTPGAFMTFLSRGTSLGTYALTTNGSMVPGLTNPQAVVLEGKNYLVQLRFKRMYKPYTIRLVKFTHESYFGTDMAKNFASRVRLIDAANHVDREVVISMNHPLRYLNDTIYQQKFNRMSGGDEGTVLQIVNNPNWLMPYFSVVIGGLGLVIHFGMTLINFLSRRLAAETTPPALPKGRGQDARRPQGRGGATESYTLQPSTPWKLIGPALSLVFGLLIVGAFFATALMPAKVGSFDMGAFAKTAVHDEGRTLPIDSLARNYLKIINGKQSFDVPVEGEKDKTKSVSAVQWLADVLARPEIAADYKVFRIDNEDLKATLGLKADEKRFSWNELFHDPANAQKLQKQFEQARAVPVKTRDAYQAKVMELYEHATTYLRLARGADYAQLYFLMTHPEQAKELEEKAAAIGEMDPAKLTADQQKLADRYHSIRSTLHDLVLPESLKGDERADADQQRQRLDLYLAMKADPTLDLDKRWVGLGQTVLDFRKDIPADPSAAAFFSILKDYRDNNPGAFNTDLAAYQKTIEQTDRGVANKAAFEVFFNGFDPFMICMWCLYLPAFLLVCTYWLTGSRTLTRSALALLVLTFLLHSIGLLCRIYISGRPPVTNLYSSAVFIGWGAVALCIGLELVFKNGVGSAVAATIGIATLLIADGLAQRDGDTMAQLQAVLDTNFWLATHVVCVTLGYAATFLAGILAIVFVLGNLFTGGLEADTRKELTRMTYGIICFAMLFSFVGTILGGIWADQSWGRFWGWDPKENGAVLIVIWNALILHARWGGIVRDKGMALLAIVGNIVTSWSWFGTNMLGIGLHSYGFMDKAATILFYFIISQIALIVAGLFIRSSKSAPPTIAAKAPMKARAVTV